jgi:DNA-binding transcriptional LysR family regulator
MESRNLATFIKVAELRSFSKTAKQLGYSQAAVTVQIKQLEEELGTKLFDRLGKRIRLTSEGEQFMPYAKAVIRANNAAKMFMTDRSEPQGTIRLGASSSTSNGILPGFLVEFCKKYPKVKIVVKSSDYFESNFEKLRQNELDVALFLDKRRPFTDCIKIADRPVAMVFVTSPESRLAGLKKVPLEDVVRENFITSDRDVSYSYYLEQYATEQGIDYNPLMELSSVNAIVSILEGGVGASYLPEFMVHDEIESGRLVKIDTVEIPDKIYIQLIVHKDKWIDAHMQIFLDCLKEMMEMSTADPEASEQ